MYQTPLDFSKQLIKGKIAELIFDQMFRRASGYTVIPFGYEAIIPEIIQYVEKSDRKELIDNIRNAPDFALVSHNPKEVLLVEVKYRSSVDMEKIRETASHICEQWKLAWLFLATPQGFYFDSCNDLINQEKLNPLRIDTVPLETQVSYLKLLNEFI